jgi:hypothetical protein
MNKKEHKLIDIAIMASFSDGCRPVAVKSDTRKAIIQLIVLMEGSIKVVDKVMDGLTFEYPENKSKKHLVH